MRRAATAEASPPSRGARNPLIPHEFVDFPTQRLYATALFVAVQAWKAKSVLEYSYLGEAHAPHLWLLLDAGFFTLLYILQIPWLNLKAWSTMLMITVFCVSDVVIFSGSKPLQHLPALMMSLPGLFADYALGYAGYRPALSQREVKIQDVLYNASHILGKHTVQFLPYSTAKLNPENRCFCLERTPPKKRKNVLLPILFNGTSPTYLQYSHIDLVTGMRQLVNLTKRDIIRFRPSDHFQQQQQLQKDLELYYIAVREPGFYKIERALDRNQTDIMLYRREALVVLCPETDFGRDKAVSGWRKKAPTQVVLPQPQHRCKGDDEESIPLWLRGLPPYRVEYVRRVNGEKLVVTMEDVKPEDGESIPAVYADGGAVMPSHSLGPVGWARDKEMTLPLNITFDAPGEVDLEILSVKDGCGNTQTYLSPTEQLSAEEEAETSLERGDSRRFTIHPRPVGKLLCDPNKPMKLLHGGEPLEIPLQIVAEEGNEWTAEIGFYPPLAEEVEEKAMRLPNEIKNITVRTKRSLFKVHAPGTYTLASVMDAHCRGEVLLPASCRVQEVAPPTVEISTTPIKSKCIGEIGISAALTLTGEPPFNVYYKVFKDKVQLPEMPPKSIDKTRHTLSLIPDVTGSYEYVFYRIDDANYEKIPIQNTVIRQVVHPQPRAEFLQKPVQGPIKSCVGGRTALAIRMSGIGPWKLHYEIIHKSHRHTYSANVNDFYHTIETPPLEAGGLYTVSLLRIEDANGCVQDLDTSDLTIDVRPFRPSAAFHSPSTPEHPAFFLENHTAQLPLELTGNKPWTVTYKAVGETNSQQAILMDPNGSLEVMRPGLYEIVQVRDAYCAGKVVPDASRYAVAWHPRPSVMFDMEQVQRKQDTKGTTYYERQKVCQGDLDAVDLHLSGRAPWLVTYERYFKPLGAAEFQRPDRLDLSASFPKTKLHLQTTEAGTYTYRIGDIADDMYVKSVPLAKQLVLEQKVYHKPSAQFIKPTAVRVACVGQSGVIGAEKPLVLEFKGLPPFNAKIRVRHENTPLESESEHEMVQLSNITESRHTLSLPTRFDRIGTYIITLEEVSDASGCGQSIPVHSEMAVKIQVLDTASITPLSNNQVYCVGDEVRFSLQGVAPWTVSYAFDQKRDTVSVSNVDFVRFADRPGELRIEKVCHLRNQCCTEPNHGVIVKDIPGARVSGGREIIETLREGDKTEINIELIGEPPFTFTYTRSAPGGILEKHTVRDVQDNKYTLYTSQEGTFEVVFVADRWCQYPHNRATHT
ncbi:uncharacterized protein VTP21DRAFT_7841 [Calcarisporiella thermophila]|uniref:uncharacterized protein n=1 Tax=Calcarisporiella thermophila TaxID=911321 RepID=UPI0037430827